MNPAPLFMNDAEIAEQIGLTKSDWQIAVIVLERGGLPTPDPLFANKRYWPAVRSFLDRRYNLGSHSGADGNSAVVDGEEEWNSLSRRALSAGQIKRAVRPITGSQNAQPATLVNTR